VAIAGDGEVLRDRRTLRDVPVEGDRAVIDERVRRREPAVAIDLGLRADRPCRDGDGRQRDRDRGERAAAHHPGRC